MMIKLTIDKQTIEVEEGSTILDAANQAGIHIPTLCYHEELTPIGSCRVCAVEIVNNGKSGLTSACNYLVEPGIKITTSSDKVRTARRLALELLLAQCPSSVKIQKLAEELGASQPSFSLGEKECILCQLCTRTCREIVDVSAISFIARGLDRDNDEALIEVSPVKCIACGSCAYICPTQAISMEDVGDMRVINTPSGRMEFKLRQCKNCGSYWAPEKQLEYMASKASLELGAFDLCPDCRD